MSNKLTKHGDTSNKQNESSMIEIRLPDIETEKLVTYQVDNSIPVHEQPETFTAFKMLIETTKDKPMSDSEASMLREAMRRDKVKPNELDHAFWEAYKDQYTAKTGIEWKNLWKFIEQRRKNFPRTDPESFEGLAAMQEKYPTQYEQKKGSYE